MTRSRFITSPTSMRARADRPRTETVAARADTTAIKDKTEARDQAGIAVSIEIKNETAIRTGTATDTTSRAM